MRPLKGVVTKASGQTLTISSESGLTLTIPKRKGMGVGSLVNIFYDFTANKVVKVHKAPSKAKEAELGGEEPEKVDVAGHEDASDEQSNVAAFEALCPAGDGCEFWDSDSGILGLSVPCSDGCRGDDHQ